MRGQSKYQQGAARCLLNDGLAPSADGTHVLRSSRVLSFFGIRVDTSVRMKIANKRTRLLSGERAIGRPPSSPNLIRDQVRL